MDPLSPANLWLTATRYLISFCALLVIGACGARIAVTGRRFLLPDAADALVTARLGRAGALASVALALSIAHALVALAYVWLGPEGLTDLEGMRAIVFKTAWGVSWQRTASTAAFAALACTVAWRWRAVRGIAAAGVALAVALAVPLLGHGGTHGVIVWLLHATHLLGSGLWLGSLAILAWATWPVWRDSSAAPTSTLRGLLSSFSPVALTGAGLVVFSGGGMTLEHVPSFAAARVSAYGQTLGVKIALVLVVALLGFLNFRTHRGEMASDADRRRVRRLALLELALAFVLVLAATAWLTGLAMPHEE
jgi:putative copper export protein